MPLLLLPLLSATASVPGVPTILLNNGVDMPQMLWGSGGPTQENSTSTAVALELALKVGFTGVDTANHYHNQDGVALAIARSGKTDVWITSKVEPCGASIITPVRQGHCYQDTIKAFQQNLEQLQVSQLDLVLLHSPPCVFNSTWADPMCVWPDQPDAVYPQNCNCAAKEPCDMMREQWRALEHMYQANLTRAIGVSNFCSACLDCIADMTLPQVNQLQFHVGMGADPSGLLSDNAKRGILVQAYSPLAGDQHSDLLNDPTVVAIAAAHGVTTGQVCLRWIIQQGLPLATSTTSEQYLEEDLEIWALGLSDAEMGQLDDLRVAPDDPVKSMCLL